MSALWIAAMTGTQVPAQPAGENLIPNPGLEEADGDGPAFWHQRTPTDADRELSWVGEEPRSGAYCLKIANHADVKSRWRVGHLRHTRLRPGSPAELSGWVRHADGPGSVYLTLYFLGTAGEVIGQPTSQRLAGDTPWTRLLVTATVPAEAAYCMVYCENEGVGTAWYDDLDLRGEVWDGDPKPEPFPTISLTVDELDVVRGLRLTTRGRTRVAEAQPGREGEAEVWFAGDTARYDVAIEYESKPPEAVRPSLLVNGTRVDWSVTEDGRSVATGVDIQHHSRLIARLSVGEGQECRLTGISFTPTGRFEGTLLSPEAIQLPPSLACYPTALDRRSLRGQLGRYVHATFVEPPAKRRAAELDALQTPDDWRRRQLQTRAMLPRILGDFSEKCPLNPRVVGTIERDAYTIERLTIESQPGYHVPCSLYVPKHRLLPVPGVIFTCGHSGEGKGYHLYHECCLGLVLKGYCVLAVEPMGQGERSEYFDPETGTPTVPLTVSQHHQLLRPLWLVGRSLAGHRTWDLHRAIDYLVARPEVDADQLAVVGNSGGGQMALLIMAYDERLDVCAAAHPGGSCENVYLTGSTLYDRRILSLIAPRPCRFIVGRDSGEQWHVPKYDDMLRFYKGLGADEERLSFEWVDGVHNMEQPKREAAYEWLNRWLDKEAEGKAEPPLEPLSAEDLWCTDTGLTMTGLASESGRSLAAKLADEIRPPRIVPGSAQEARRQIAEVREAVTRRIGARVPSADREPPRAREVGEVGWDTIQVRKLLLVPEPGIEVPALLLSPPDARSPVILHAAEGGKPSSLDNDPVPRHLAGLGYRVLSVDVRGIGEADPSPIPWPNPSRGYQSTQWSRDVTAINCAYGDTTMLALRAYDLVRCVDWLQGELGDPPLVCAGEGLGGVWAMVAAALDERIDGVVCRSTLGSYRSIFETPLYTAQGYFWVPGALHDYDLPDLPALIAPRPVLWLDPVDPELQASDVGEVRTGLSWTESVYEALGAGESLAVEATEAPDDPARAAEGIGQLAQRLE